MKRFLLILSAVCFCFGALAHTIRWHIGDEIIETTTCDSGDTITPPTVPTITGHYFIRWDAYTSVEYLESGDGTYIDTGFIANQDTRVIIDQQTLACGNKVDSVPICSWITYNARAFCLRGCGNSLSAYYISYGNGNVNYGEFEDDFQRHVLELNKNVFYLDNVRKLTFGYANFQTPNALKLFQGSAASVLRIFSVKIYDNDILTRDMMPVIDSNGIACMYDKVTNQFFYNQGTGQFVAGPAI